MTGGRFALVVGVSAYDDPGLSELAATKADLGALQKVLEDTEIGAFDEVVPLLNPTREQFFDGLQHLFDNRMPEDLVLLYFSGHGVLDIQNRFFFAVRPTRLQRLRATAVDYRDVHEIMDESTARGQLVILDCCHAGAFGRRLRAATGDKALDQSAAGSVEDRPGSGRWVLAATDATSFAFEQDELIAKAEQVPQLGLFTRTLVDGLRGGAGPSKAAWITAEHLFEFAEREVRKAMPSMRPQRWVAQGSAPLRLAKRRRSRSASVPFPSFQDAPFAPEMVVLPAGAFLMGSPECEAGRRQNEGPQRQISVASFAIGRYPVTFSEYYHFCDANGRDKPDDEEWGRERMPVINVAWNDAVAYTTWLAEQTGKPYRLPSEAEWEYACRAGTETAYWWGDAFDPRKANTREGGPSRTTAVGSYSANFWGLFDMHGNVWEWAEDHRHDNYQGAPRDSRAWVDAAAEGDRPRVLRGGSWLNYLDLARCASRGRYAPDDRRDNMGLRVVCSLPS